MAFKYANRVFETSVTTGEGDFVLLGPEQGWRSFSSFLVTGDTTYYCAEDASGVWEIGLGTMSSNGDLARTTVIDSSSAGAKVAFTPGTKKIFCHVPAEATISDQKLDTELAKKLSKSSNLSDVPNAGIARTNLGLGSIATFDRSVSTDLGASDTLIPSQNAVKVYADTKVPKTTTVNGKDLSGNITLTKSDIGLDDVSNVEQMPLTYLDTNTNLGTSDVLVPTQNAVKTYADSKLSKASNLNDVANKATARTNLGLTSSATTETTANNLDSTVGRLLKVGDFGIGRMDNGIRLSTSELEGPLPNGVYAIDSSNSSSEKPSTFGVMWAGSYSGANDRKCQIWMETSTAKLFIRSTQKSLEWENVLTTSNTNLIVSSGSNANGSWTKLVDGTQICVISDSSNIYTTSSTFGNIFVSDPVSFTYPASFISTPSVTTSVSWDSGRPFPGLVVSNSKSGFNTHIYGATVTTKGYIQAIAIGRWK